MTLRIKLSHLVASIVIAAMLLTAGYAVALSRTTTIRACINRRSRALIVPADHRCRRGYAALSWARQGPRGKNGRRGRQGATGAAGSPATVTIGSVSTEPPGSQATVTNSGTASNAVLNFGIPQGSAGANATSSGPTAYGEVWMGGNRNSAFLARGSANVSVGGGVGTATIAISGCSPAGLQEPLVTVTANHDPHDGLTGSNNTTSGTAAAYVTGWLAAGTILDVNVSTYDSIAGSTVNSDFAFTVYC